MKNLVFNLAIALIVIAYVSNVSFHSRREVKASKNNNQIVLQTNNPVFEQEVTGSDKLINNEGLTSIRIERVVADANQMSRKYFSNENSLYNVAVDNFDFNRAEKTIEEIIAEDNQIIESNLSDAGLSYNMTIDNIVFDRSEKAIEEIIAEDNAIIGNDFSEVNLSYNVAIDNVAFNKTAKTIEEIIAEDNEITDNNFSNETQALAFR